MSLTLRAVPLAALLGLALFLGAGAARAGEGPAPTPPAAERGAAAGTEAINLNDDADNKSPAARKARQSAVSSPLSLAARTGFWLGVILAGICGLMYLAKKVMPRSSGWGRNPAAELMGRTCLESKRSVYLLKVGNRLLVVGSAENGLSALAEITDRAEVEHVVCLARNRGALSGGAEFSKILGGKLSRLAGLVGRRSAQVVAEEEFEAEEEEALVGSESASGPEFGAREGRRTDALGALKAQVEKLKNLS